MTGLSRNWVDMTSVLPAPQIAGDTPEETHELNKMLSEAESFLASHSWCGQIVERYFGYGVSKVVAVFLFRIAPTQPGVDEWLWTIVGDLPSAYLVTEGNSTPVKALEGYMLEMRRWIDAVRAGRPTGDLVPVNASSTKLNAEALQSRLDLIRQIILPELESPGKDGHI